LGAVAHPGKGYLLSALTDPNQDRLIAGVIVRLQANKSLFSYKGKQIGGAPQYGSLAFLPVPFNLGLKDFRSQSYAEVPLRVLPEGR
jgi:hypothetical protein